jgi:transcriptional regulator with XRE-family HTH domain
VSRNKFQDYERNIWRIYSKLRLDNGLTLTKLAAALDIDQSTLSKIENGKRNVPAEIIPKLSAFFSLDLKN